MSPPPPEGREPIACPQCGKTAWVVPNPYFGIGLAVHEHLIICGHCGLGAFKPNGPRPDAEPQQPRERTTPRNTSISWFRRKQR